MDEMMQTISRYPNGTVLKVSWQFGKIVIEGLIDTIYETDNGLENTEDYREYFACAFKVQKIIRNLGGVNLERGQLIEISKYNEPTSIELENHTIIWKL